MVKQMLKACCYQQVSNFGYRPELFLLEFTAASFLDSTCVFLLEICQFYEKLISRIMSNVSIIERLTVLIII